MRTRTIAIAACCSLLGACATMIGPENAFRMTSPGMSDDQMMAPNMAGNFKKNPNCTGDNISPALEWSHAPAKTRSFALIVVDKAGRVGLGVSHGVIYGIPASVTSLPEGALAGPHPTVGVGGSNTLNMPYVGPCTPRNTAPHHYVFTLIATDLEPNALQPGLKQDALLKAIEGHGLDAASLVFRFAQPG